MSLKMKYESCINWQHSSEFRWLKKCREPVYISMKVACKRQWGNAVPPKCFQITHSLGVFNEMQTEYNEKAITENMAKGTCLIATQ